MSKAAELIKCIFDKTRLSKSFGQVLKNAKIVSVEDGKVKAELKICEDHLNLGGSLHGGYISTLVDCFSTYALMAYKNSPPGVSVDLHVTFLKPAFCGDVVIIDAKTVKVGRRLAFLKVKILKADDGAIVARGIQTKFIGGD
ncbi:PREDICTED: acyl-coenzyme A thioesterase 13 [Ceratosolen solmsi marchali]|uniref:Acyl-coenzyme A thioesterase 13 n=1 Tax=Ceratosolen solmsi marchali TaxID=326594 RepID=A0AAJ6YKE6_9HYME|nr:PREDICTED: acyl-coenzyme A thioesterase 13 [Ceratosolen solmsi marchali]